MLAIMTLTLRGQALRSTHGHLYRDAVKRLGIEAAPSMTKLASGLGCTPSHIALIFQRKRRGSEALITGLADLLGVTPRRLIRVLESPAR